MYIHVDTMLILVYTIVASSELPSFELFIGKWRFLIMQTLKLRKWGNSNAIRFPKALLKQVGISSGDEEVSVNVTRDSIVIKPKKKEKELEKLFEGYDTDQPYPFEVVDKGGAVGEELI